MSRENSDSGEEIDLSNCNDPNEIFAVLAELGKGSYGAVYKAIDQRDDSTCAVKVLEADSEEFEDLQREVKILEKCNSPHIVQYKGSFSTNGHAVIAMEYCDAGSVLDIMEICSMTLDENHIAAICEQALRGLAYLHSMRIIHRDIKAANILLNKEGVGKLADFGVSVQLVNTLSKRHSVIGTPYWMAPEVLKSVDYNWKADVWSLAIAAIEMASGKPPHYQLHPMRAIFKIPNSPPPTLPNPEKYSTEFKHFLKMCLQFNPSDRPSAKHLLKHPFIQKKGPKDLLKNLVKKVLPQIEKERENRMQEQDEKYNTIDGLTIDNDAKKILNSLKKNKTGKKEENDCYYKYGLDVSSFTFKTKEQVDDLLTRLKESKKYEQQQLENYYKQQQEKLEKLLTGFKK